MKSIRGKLHEKPPTSSTFQNIKSTPTRILKTPTNKTHKLNQNRAPSQLDVRTIPLRNLSNRTPSPRPVSQRVQDLGVLTVMPCIKADPMETLETEVIDSLSQEPSLDSIDSQDRPQIQFPAYHRNYKTLAAIRTDGNRQESQNSTSLNTSKDCSLLVKSPGSNLTPNCKVNSSLFNKTLEVSQSEDVTNKYDIRKDKSLKPTALFQKFISSANKPQQKAQQTEFDSAQTERIDICNIFKKLNSSELHSPKYDDQIDGLFESTQNTKRNSNANFDSLNNVSFNSSLLNPVAIVRGSSTNRNDSDNLAKCINLSSYETTKKSVSNFDKTKLKSKDESEQNSRLEEVFHGKHSSGRKSKNNRDSRNAHPDLQSPVVQSLHESISPTNLQVRHKNQNALKAVTSKATPKSTQQKEIRAYEAHLQKITQTSMNTSTDKGSTASKVLDTSQQSKMLTSKDKESVNQRSRKNISLSISDEKAILSAKQNAIKSTAARNRTPSAQQPIPVNVKINLAGVDLRATNSSRPTSTDRRSKTAQQINVTSGGYLNISFVKALGCEPLKEEDIVNTIIPSNKSEFSYSPTYFKPISDTRMSQFLQSLSSTR